MNQSSLGKLLVVNLCVPQSNHHRLGLLQETCLCCRPLPVSFELYTGVSSGPKVERGEGFPVVFCLPLLCPCQGVIPLL